MASTIQIGSAAPGFAQEVDHSRIEALFAILEQSATPPPAPPPAPAPPVLTPPEVVSKQRGAQLFSSGGEPVEGCPSQVPEFTAAVEEAEELRVTYQRQIERLEEAFDIVSEDMLDLRIEGEFTCPDRLVARIDGLAESLEEFNAGDHLLSIEALGACAQRTATRLGDEMDEISFDAPIDQQRRRGQLSRALDLANGLDGRITTVLTEMARMRQKQLRLITANDLFADDCASTGNLSFDTEIYE